MTNLTSPFIFLKTAGTTNSSVFGAPKKKYCDEVQQYLNNGHTTDHHAEPPAEGVVVSEMIPALS